jgi:hypothetical protein
MATMTSAPVWTTRVAVSSLRVEGSLHEHQILHSQDDGEAMTMDNIPEFYGSDEEWESGEYASLKRQYDALCAKEKAPEQAMRALLQRVADFNFLEVLNAQPSPEGREVYTQLMVDVRLALRAISHG